MTLAWSYLRKSHVVFGAVACLLIISHVSPVQGRVAELRPRQDSVSEQDWPSVEEVEAQPLLASTLRLAQAMEYLGNPLPHDVLTELESLDRTDDPGSITERVQELLDVYCLAALTIGGDQKPVVQLGPNKPELIEQGWRTFLIKVINPDELKCRVMISSPNSLPLPHSPADQVATRWMQLASFEGQPLRPSLSGLELEYRVVQIYSRDAGHKTGLLEFAISGEPGSPGEVIREWRFDRDTDEWFAMNQCEIESSNGSLQFVSSGRDPYMGSPVSAEGGEMVLRFWAKTDAQGVGQVFWWTEDRPNPDGQRRVNFVLQSGRDNLYEIPFTVDGKLAGVRLDPLSQPGQMQIDWIDLCSAQQSANRASVAVEFESVPSNRVTFRVTDELGNPCFARFLIKDANGAVFPAQSKRLAPDFFFHAHIYRGDGESIALPDGEYTIVCMRGPESVPEVKTVTVDASPIDIEYQVKRWIDPALAGGWWSGDHHIHAAGCQHYENPTQGVHPEDMLRHIMGEDLKVGCCLTWGPCFDYQKRFFTGKVAEQSRYPYLLRYDVEVSGFGSHMSGHLNLLNLTDQIYPGGESKDHWPTLGLNTLRWAQRQGAVCGPAHSSIGLTNTIGRVPGTEGMDGELGLPNYRIPAFDGIGANEFIVDVTHRVPGPDGELVPAVDFISAMNTQRVAEWNMWYHVLNCGFRVAVSGETDFPCISGERVGLGRVYAQVDGELTFEKWVQSIADGRSYVSDGTTHLLNFRASAEENDEVQQVAVGIDGSELRLSEPGIVTLNIDVAGMRHGDIPFIYEIVVNGRSVRQVWTDNSGAIIPEEHEVEIGESAWIAIRSFPSAHTNPIYVIVDDQPIRASLESAEWCLLGVEQCWRSKQPTYHADEQADAREAFEHARRTYQEIIDQFNE